MKNPHEIPHGKHGYFSAIVGDFFRTILESRHGGMCVGGGPWGTTHDNMSWAHMAYPRGLYIHLAFIYSVGPSNVV